MMMSEDDNDDNAKEKPCGLVRHLCPVLSHPHPHCLSPSLVDGETILLNVELDLTWFIALTRQMVRMERRRQGMSLRATLWFVLLSFLLSFIF